MSSLPDVPKSTWWEVVAVEQRTCATHGAYEARIEVLRPQPKRRPWTTAAWRDSTRWSNCPTCDATWAAEAEATDAEIRGGMSAKKRLADERLRRCGIPTRFMESTVWNWNHAMDQQRRVWSWVRDYLNNFDAALQSGRSGAFIGAPGTGKTHLGIGMLRHVIEKGGTGVYCTVMDLLGRIKATFNERAGGETEADVMQLVGSCDFLVIDEVGRSLDSNYEMAQFFRVLDRRYRDVKPTLLLSNLGKAKFAEFLGDAVVDRFREAGGMLYVFDWASQRSTKKIAAEGDEE